MQSALEKHPTQSWVVVLQTGVGAAQSAFARQVTHWFEPTSHLGVAGLVQSEFAVQTTHDPAFDVPLAAQAGPTGLPTQSALVAQGWQVWATHAGRAPAQSVLNSQATQVPVG